MTCRRLEGRASLVLASLILLLAWPSRGADFTIDASQTNQVIDGFGVNANYYEWDSNGLPAALDALIDDAGMTLFRVVFQNNWESTNDNADPNVMNWNYYNQIYAGPEFQKLWGIMRYLNQRGVTNGIVLNFQGNGPDWMGGNTLTPGLESEWAEMIASLLIYARNTEHLQFHLVAPNNEPNLTTEGIGTADGTQYTLALHDLANLLDANGLSDVRFVGPDLAYGGTDYLSEIMSDPVVMAKMEHFGVHSYADNGSGTMDVPGYIADGGFPDRDLWVTEFNVWCAQCEAAITGTNTWDYAIAGAHYLFGHLYFGASAGFVWEGYDSYYPHHNNWSFWGLLAVDDINASPKTYTRRKEFSTLSQVTKFVRPGAQSISVTGPGEPLYVLAFYHNELGQLTIVGINDSQSPALFTGALASLPNLPSLELYYTSADTDLNHAATVSVAPDHTFGVTIPADCIFTLTGFDPAKTSMSVAITNPADGTFLTAPANLIVTASATTTTGILSSVSFYAGTNHLGDVAQAPFALPWTNVPPGIYTLTAWATNSVGYTAVSPVVQLTVTGPLATISVNPQNPTLAVGGSLTFTATGTDLIGTALNPQPAFVWSASDGGVIDTNGVFTSWGMTGGPFTISATSGGVTGLTSVTVAPLNVAPQGAGISWYRLVSPTDASPSASAPGLNDGDTNSDVSLSPGFREDVLNAYEAAGIVWGTTQAIASVVYMNGSYDAYEDGVFAAEFQLQFSGDGVSWTNAGPDWVSVPSYAYNSPASADTSFTFSGSVAVVRGIRCVGRVHTTASSPPPNSWVAFATEVQAFAPVPPVAPFFIQQPVSITNLAGTPVAFSGLAIGTTPLVYQWRLDDAPLADATNSAFAINSVQAQDAGNYSLLVSNLAGSATSSVAVLTVVTPPPPPMVSLRATLEAQGVGLWWPVAGSNYILESAVSPTAPAMWQSVTDLPTLVGGEWQVIVPRDFSRQFFRLRLP